MNTRNALRILLAAVGGLFANLALAAHPTCSAAGETLLKWPATNPIWELCWLPPSQSSGQDGSSLEIRKVHYKGVLVVKQAHLPILFAEYRNGAGGDCYRDWKNANARLLADTTTRNQLGIAVNPPNSITSCERSSSPTTSYGACPYGLAGYTQAANCFFGVAIEDQGDHVVLKTQHSADWYQYTSQYILWGNGDIEPRFGFGNSNGTYNSVTHWHHAYWRFDWDIDGSAGDQISQDGVARNTEFTALRNPTGGAGGGPITWDVMDTKGQFGYRVIPGSNDDTFPANQSGRNFHDVDVIGTLYVAGEYMDDPNNDLGNCDMSSGVLANSQNIQNTDVVLYYRASVRDTTANNWPDGNGGFLPQDSMICKGVGPRLTRVGDWPIFRDGFE